MQLLHPGPRKDNSYYYFSLLYSVGEAFGFEIKTPWQDLTEEQQDVLLNGSRDPILIQADSRYRKGKGVPAAFRRDPADSGATVT